MSHLPTKPFMGGRAAMATAPPIMTVPVQGIRFINPPSCSMSRVPVPCKTLPAARNISPFMRAWFQMCNRAAVMPNAATIGRWFAWPHTPMPSARAIRPMFSMLEYARTRLMSR